MTCFFRNIKGAVTPATCIVLSAVVFLNLAFVDYFKIFSARKLSKEVQSLGAYSSLSLYYETLFEDYGLYAFYKGDKSEIENTFADIILSNSTYKASGSKYSKNGFPELELMKYKPYEFKITPQKSLSEIEVFEDQISGIMKYKTPANMLKKVASIVKELTGVTSMTGIYGKYVKLSKLYDDYKYGLEKIYIVIDGTTDLSVDCVNGLENFPICADSAFARNIKANFLLPSGTVYTEESAKLLKQALAMYSLPAKMLIEPNEQAEKQADDLLAIINDQNGYISDIEEWLEDFEPETVSEEGFCDAMRDMISEIEETQIAFYLPAVINYVSKNKNSLNTAYAQWAKIDSKIFAGNTIPVNEVVSLLECLSQVYSDYNLVNMPPDDGSLKLDAEKYKDYLLEKEISGLDNRIVEDAVVPNEIYYTLPSVKYSEESFFLNLKSVLEKDNNVDNIFETMDLCSDIGENLSKNFEESVNDIYINDFIMENMHCDSDESVEIGQFMKSEIEYIITGRQKEKDNVSNVYSKIIELRTGLNTVHIISDSEKMQAAKTAGSALASVSGEIGASVYTAMIISSWAFSEAVIDAVSLERGETVPLIKQKGDWKTSIDGLSFGSAYMPGRDSGYGNNTDEITDSDNILSMDYKDYLLILLLQMPKELKLYRIQDIIELNLYKESNNRILLSEFYTEIKCETKYIVETILYVDKGEKKYIFSEVNYATY